MRFRLGTYVSTLAVAFLFYAAMVTLIFEKISSLIEPGFGVNPAAPVQDHGLAFFIGVNVCALWLAAQLTLRLCRRANRHRLGFCHGCGKRLTMEMNRCPLCGEKRALFGSTESLFPVIMPDKELHTRKPPAGGQSRFHAF
jgi:uncharacterized paraquat-inducible protein A